MKRVAKINVSENIELLKKVIENDDYSIPENIKKAIGEHNEVIQILLDRLEKRRLGRKKSEKKKKKNNDDEDKNKEKKENNERNQLPSERYPNAPVIVEEIKPKHPPICNCCSKEMTPSGLSETTEHLEIIPKKIIIMRQIREKYKCGGCYEGLVTTPAPPRIFPRSSYGDSFIIDVALSKYAYLIPIQRYVSMAADMGFEGLPQNSLIRLTHRLANFLQDVYSKMKKEVQSADLMHADETTHRMLERGDGRQWYSWGFSSQTSCYFTIRNNRAGEVAEDFLKESKATALMSDAYSGYGKAIKKVNKHREKENLKKMRTVYCNAHARRKFTDAESNFGEEVGKFLENYRQIYKLEKESKLFEEEQKGVFREKMREYFENMKNDCAHYKESCPERSTLATALRYFENHYDNLTVCVDDPTVPLDNNHQERLLRKQVVGRKTWYGTHSPKGAKTVATLFTITEGCKLVGVNCREYFLYVVKEKHRGNSPPTPREYAQMMAEEMPPPPPPSPLPPNIGSAAPPGP